MRFNCRFADMMKTTTDGNKAADFRKFNMIVQNTIMPVTYGLSPEDTVIINGTTTGVGAALQQPDLTGKTKGDIRFALWNPKLAAAGFLPTKSLPTEEKRLQSSSLSHMVERAGQGCSLRHLDVDSSNSQNDEPEPELSHLRGQTLRLGLARELSNSDKGSKDGSAGAEGRAAAHPTVPAAADRHMLARELRSRPLKVEDLDAHNPVLDVENSIVQTRRPRPFPMNVALAEPDASADDDKDTSDAPELQIRELEVAATALASHQPHKKQQASRSAPTAVLAGGASTRDASTGDLVDVGEASGTASAVATTCMALLAQAASIGSCVMHRIDHVERYFGARSCLA
jgi:hypothetical protein